MDRRRKWLLIALVVLDVLCVAFILTRSMKPAVESDEESGGFLAFLLQFFPWMTMHIVRKLAHFTEFFVLGGLLGATCRVGWRPMLWQPFAGAALVACMDETIQRFVPGRSGQLKDVALDCAGALVAVLLLWGVCKLRERRRAAKGK